ncbi:MAG: hypothetical protein L0216_02170 [Planctomycetales bacterium]|nr:hypothetical protein [Planctomycetales bacterium]
MTAPARTFFALCWLALLPPVGPVARAQDAPGAARDAPLDMVSLNLDGAPLEDMIDLVAHHSQKIFLFQDRLKQVRIYSKGRRLFPAKDVFSVFQSILELNGFALTTIARDTPGEVIKVVESRNMRRYPMRIYDAREVLRDPGVLPGWDEMVTITFPLRYGNAKEIANAIRPLSHPGAGGQIIGVEGSEVLVIVDFGPNANRLVQIADQLDRPSPNPAREAVLLRRAESEGVAAELRRVLEAEGRHRVSVVTIGPARGPGTLLLVGDWTEVQRAKELALELDARAAGAGERPSDGKGK